MSDRRDWLCEGNTSLGLELLEAHADERAPASARARSLEVARAALAPIGVVAVGGTTTPGAAAGGINAGGVGAGSVSSAGSASMAAPASAAVSASVSPAGLSVSAGASGVAGVGKSLASVQALPTGAGLAPAALSSGVASSGAAVAASVKGGGMIASLLAGGGLKVTLGAALLAGGTYLGVASGPKTAPQPGAHTSIGTPALEQKPSLAPETGASEVSGSAKPVSSRGVEASTSEAQALSFEGLPKAREREPSAVAHSSESASQRVRDDASQMRRSPSAAASGTAASSRQISGRSDTVGVASRATEGSQVAGVGALAGGAANPAVTGRRGPGAKADSVYRSNGASAPAKERASGAADRGSLAMELELIKQARAELQRGRRAAALRALSEHARRFPSGALKPEASELRRRALGR